jgi:hypothetical protein
VDAQLTSPDVDRIDRALDRQLQVDARGRLVQWVRKDSWPYPESITGTTQATDKPGPITGDPVWNYDTAGWDARYLRDDTGYARAQARRKLWQEGRLRKDGALISRGLVLGLDLGTQIDQYRLVSESGERLVNARCVVRAIRWRWVDGRIETHLERA